MTEPILSVRDLVAEFTTERGVVRAVDGVSWDVYPGETLAVVGESGSGKSVTALSVLGLLPAPHGKVAAGEVTFDGRDLRRMPAAQLRRVRGAGITMVFQDPMTSLNPVFTVGGQIAEAIVTHQPGTGGARARQRSVELLELVGVPNAKARFNQYPHEYSGGMRQRAMIAMAIANEPKVLIADEPTTALDVTIQAQVMEVLRTAQEATQAATVLITHDLGVVAEMADRVVVMYAGKVVETGDVGAIFHAPRHPYTLGLMASLPRLDADVAKLAPIQGEPPSLLDPPPGCRFHPRCRLSRGRARCREEVPQLSAVTGAGHQAACHFHDEVDQETRRVSEETGVDIGEPA